MQTISVTEAKAKLPSLVESVESTHDVVIITRHSKRAAALLSFEHWESLQLALAWLSDPTHSAEMTEAEAQFRDGRILSLDEVRARLKR